MLYFKDEKVRQWDNEIKNTTQLEDTAQHNPF